MYLIIPHSSPHRGNKALPHGSFIATYAEETEKDEASLELNSATTGDNLARLSGQDAEDAWESIERVTIVNAPDVVEVKREKKKKGKKS